ncbi:transcription factor SOX-18-like [Dermacentor albipictus]|uniref:transcription factor SOX-18-like n=1 Tax=Dermacentor albipictus TaxID=60249 RepID=UPI0038FC71A4
MLVADGKRRSVAAENPNENNQRVSSRPGKLWRSLSVADKEPRQRKAAAAAAVHRRKYPGYVYNPREAKRCKRQARRTKATARKLKNGTSRDKQKQPSISTAVAQGRGSPEFQQQQHPPPPLPPQGNQPRATSAARGSNSGAGQAMPLPRLSATRTATASARSAARPYSVHRFPGPLPPSARGANRENAVPTDQLTAARAFKQRETQNDVTTLDNQRHPRSWATNATRLRARRRSTRAESGRPKALQTAPQAKVSHRRRLLAAPQYSTASTRLPGVRRQLQKNGYRLQKIVPSFSAL